MPEESPLRSAEVAVKDYLKLDQFIDARKNDLYERMEQADKRVTGIGEGGGCVRPECDLAFIAECLPLMSALLRVGSSPASYKKAVEWVSGAMPGTDAQAVLSALVFLYVVRNALKEVSNDPTRVAIWQRINGRLDRFFKV